MLSFGTYAGMQGRENQLRLPRRKDSGAVRVVLQPVVLFESSIEPGTDYCSDTQRKRVAILPL